MMLSNQLKRCVVFLSILILSACATITGGDQRVLISQQMVEEKISERLSAPISLLKIFNIQLSNPKVAFDETQNRMRVSLDSDLTSLFMKGEHVKGLAELSGGLEYDPARQAVVLQSPKIEKIGFGEMDGKQEDMLNAFANVISSELLNGFVLYKVDPAELNVNGTQYMPKALDMTQQGLQITLSPEQ